MFGVYRLSIQGGDFNASEIGSPSYIDSHKRTLTLYAGRSKWLHRPSKVTISFDQIEDVELDNLSGFRLGDLRLFGGKVVRFNCRLKDGRIFYGQAPAIAFDCLKRDVQYRREFHSNRARTIAASS